MIPIINIQCEWVDNGRDLDVEYAKELAQSIQANGLIENIVLRPTSGDWEYTVVAGYHRFYALDTILHRTELADGEYSIKDISRKEAHVINLVENIQRKDMSYWQQAKAIRNTFDPTVNIQTIRDATSKSYRWVRTRWLLWELDTSVLKAVEDGLLTSTDVGDLLSLDPAQREEQAARLRVTSGSDKSEIKKKIVGRPRFVGRQRAHRMMAVIEEKKLQMTPHQALLWCAGDFTNEKLAEQLGIDPSELKAAE